MSLKGLRKNLDKKYDLIVKQIFSTHEDIDSEMVNFVLDHVRNQKEGLYKDIKSLLKNQLKTLGETKTKKAQD